MEKPFTEMTSRELFLVLTGDRGVIPQMYLQNIIKEYLRDHEEPEDLPTMVKAVAAEEDRQKE